MIASLPAWVSSAFAIKHYPCLFASRQPMVQYKSPPPPPLHTGLCDQANLLRAMRSLRFSIIGGRPDYIKRSIRQ